MRSDDFPAPDGPMIRTSLAELSSSPCFEFFNDRACLLVTAKVDRRIFRLQSVNPRIRIAIIGKRETASEFTGNSVQALFNALETIRTPVDKVDRLQIRQDCTATHW